MVTRRVWGADVGSLTGLRAFLVRLLRLLWVSGRDFSEGQINLRAMSLVYTSLLSLVPLLAVSFSVLKAFGVHNQVEPLLGNFLQPLGPRGAELTRHVIGFVENLRVGVLGSIGLALLVYTVISLIEKIEAAFNDIWRIRRPRSFARRFSDYMSVILVGPVLVFSALGLTASIMSTAVVRRLIAVEPFGSVFYAAGKVLPFVFVCAAFTFVYLFVPSTKVHVRSALAGGLFAGVLWETAGIGFASFVVSSARYAAVYSGFAILVLFMIWIYLSWLIVLFGAKVAFYHQFPHFLDVRKEAILLSNRLEEKLAFVVMALVGRSHLFGGAPWTLEALLDRLRLPVEPVQDVLLLLQRRGFLVESSREPPAYLPARDLETIPLVEIARAVRTFEGESDYVETTHLSLPGVDELMDEVDEAVGGRLQGRSLRDLVRAHPPDGADPRPSGD